VDGGGVVGNGVGRSGGDGSSDRNRASGDRDLRRRVDRSNRAGGLDDRADDRADGGAVGDNRGRGVRRGNGGVGRRTGLAVVLVGDAELGSVLVLAGLVVDELDAVALGTLRGLKGALGLPGVAAAVLDLLGDGVDGDEVLSRALEEDERDGALSGRVPSDGEALVDGNDGVQARLGDGVALRSIASRSGVGRDQRSESGEACGEKTEHGGRHFERLFVGWKVVSSKNDNPSEWMEWCKVTNVLS